MRGKTGRCLFLYKKGACFAVFFSCAARLFRRRILFLTAIHLRKLRCFGACFSTFLFACFHSGDKPPRWRENFACKSGCSGGRVRCSCAARCVSPGIDSTPVLLSWIVLVWLSPLDFLSHRTSDIAPARGSSPAYSRSPVCPSRCHGGRTLLGNGYSVVMRRKNSSLIPTFRGRFVNPHR